MSQDRPHPEGLRGIGGHLDAVALRRYRLQRLQQELIAADCAAALLLDPINIRYATDTRNMAVWSLHTVGRYCLVPASGPATLFEFPSPNCAGLWKDIETVGEVRSARIYNFLLTGEHAARVAQLWAGDIGAELRRLAGSGVRLAVDRIDPLGISALGTQQLVLVDLQGIIDRARSIKSPDEIVCMREALAVADAGMGRMRAALRPGISENELWAELHYANIALGGEWIETRLLSSGPRTNPWFQECSDRIVRAGELVGVDTDLVGPHGYCADVSRTFLCGSGNPTAAQRELYSLAAEQVQHNCDVLRPGLSFADVCAHAWKIPERFRTQQYGMVAHGVGMVDEWPVIGAELGNPYPQEGVLEPGMTLCVESYIGEVGGSEGVKLEQQVLVTATGSELLSTFPLEESLLT
jgi:Xaa-Pro dipeptidase